MPNPLDIIESGPSTAARILTRTTRMTVRTALQLGCHLSHLPWPYGAIELAAGIVPKSPRTKRTTVHLPNCTAELIRAPGVTHNAGRVVLYLHGGGFLTCGSNTHSGLITRLSRASNAPILAVNYRMIPANTLDDAIEDCLDGYSWLRRHYEPKQIVIAGDSAGGYLTLSLANLLGETPAGLAMLSPLLQLNPTQKNGHPNIRCDAMFGPEAFDALYSLMLKQGEVYEPLDSLSSYLPPTLIHVSGHEALLSDARLAADRLSGLGIPVELHVWPGQIHVFQIAAPLVPEAKRSLEQIGAFVQASTEDFNNCNSERLTRRTATVG